VQMPIVVVLCDILLSVVIQSHDVLSIFMPIAVLLIVVMLSVVILSVVLLNLSHAK
jgi:hypothetical protein